MRSQASLFIIAGLIALIGMSFIFFWINKDKLDIITGSHDVDYSKKVKPVSDFANACLNKISLEGMAVLGEQGTIYPNVYIASDDRKITYFYFKGKGYFPSRNKIEGQLSDYLKENIKSCLNGFSETKFVVEDTGKGIDIISRIDENKITVEMIYPVNVYYESKVIPLEKFKTEIRTEFSSIYEISQKIYQETEKNPDWINLEMLQETEYKIRLVKVDSNTLVYEITDEKGLEGKPFRYSFAVKYEL